MKRARCLYSFPQWICRKFGFYFSTIPCVFPRYIYALEFLNFHKDHIVVRDEFGLFWCVKKEILEKGFDYLDV